MHLRAEDAAGEVVANRAAVDFELGAMHPRTRVAGHCAIDNAARLDAIHCVVDDLSAHDRDIRARRIIRNTGPSSQVCRVIRESAIGDVESLARSIGLDEYNSVKFTEGQAQQLITRKSRRPDRHRPRASTAAPPRSDSLLFTSVPTSVTTPSAAEVKPSMPYT